MPAAAADKAPADYMLEGLLQRLELVRLEPGVIVVAGLDDSQQRRFSEGWQQKHMPRSPLVDLAESADGTGNLVIGLAPPQSDPSELAPSLRSCLKIGGCLMFACLGRGTAEELNEGKLEGAKEPISCKQRPVLTDMHNFGDALQAHGFASLVVESERMLWAHSGFNRWHEDLVQLGFAFDGDAAAVRQAWSEGRRAAPPKAKSAPWNLGVEIVYAHGWAADPAQTKAAGNGDQPLLDLRQALGFSRR